jgi:hypothetical protein
MKGEHGVKESKHKSLEPEVGQGYGDNSKMKNESHKGNHGYTIPHEHEMEAHHHGLEKEPKATMGEKMKGKGAHSSNHREHDTYLHESMPDKYKGDCGY